MMSSNPSSSSPAQLSRRTLDAFKKHTSGRSSKTSSHHHSSLLGSPHPPSPLEPLSRQSSPAPLIIAANSPALSSSSVLRPASSVGSPVATIQSPHYCNNNNSNNHNNNLHTQSPIELNSPSTLQSRPSNSSLQSPSCSLSSSGPQNHTPPAGTWSVSGKSVRKKASGLFREAARSWGRSKSKEVLTLGLGVLIGSPEPLPTPPPRPSSSTTASGGYNLQKISSSHERPYSPPPCATAHHQTVIDSCSSSTPVTRAPPPESSPAHPGSLHPDNNPHEPYTISTLPGSAETIGKGPKKRISFHGTHKLKLKDSSHSKMKRRSEIGFGDWADTLNTAVATSTSSPVSPPTASSHPKARSSALLHSATPIEQSPIISGHSGLRLKLNNSSQHHQPGVNNSLQVESMSLSFRRRDRPTTHIKPVGCFSSDIEPISSPPSVRIPRSTFPHPHRSPRSPRRTYQTRAASVRNQTLQNHLESTATPALPAKSPSGTTHNSRQQYQQPHPLTSSPFKRSVSPINQFEDDFDVESPIASKSQGRIALGGAVDHSESFRKLNLPRTLPQSPLTSKASASPSTVRLRSVSSARANLFGATPNQSRGLESFFTPPLTAHPLCQPHSLDPSLDQQRRGHLTSTIKSVNPTPHWLNSLPAHSQHSHHPPSVQASPLPQLTSSLPRSRQRTVSANLPDQADCSPSPGLDTLTEKERDSDDDKYCDHLSSPSRHSLSNSMVRVDGSGSPIQTRRISTGSSIKGCSSLSRRDPSSSCSSTSSNPCLPQHPSDRNNSGSHKSNREREASPDSWVMPQMENLGMTPRSHQLDESCDENDTDEQLTHTGSSKPSSSTSIVSSKTSSHEALRTSSTCGQTPGSHPSRATLSFDGFGALPPPESPFPGLKRPTQTSSHKRLSQTNASPNKLKRDLDGELVGSTSQLPPPRHRTSLRPPSSHLNLRLKSDPFDSATSNRDSWGHQSLEASENDDDEVGLAGNAELDLTSHESHEAMSNLSVPGLTDSSSLASSLASSNQSAHNAYPHHPSVGSTGLVPGATTWDKSGTESGREAKRRSLPTNVGRMSTHNFGVLPPLPTGLIMKSSTEQSLSPHPTSRTPSQPADGHSDQDVEISFQNVKPNASAFLSSGMVSKKAAMRDRREQSFGIDSPFLKYALPSDRDPNLSTAHSSGEDSLAVRSMREALGGPEVIAAAVKEDEEIQERLKQRIQDHSFSTHSSCQQSGSPNHSFLGILPPDLARRRPSASSFRMPDTPMKKATFLLKTSASHLGLHKNKPLVSSSLSKEAAHFSSSLGDGSPVGNSPSSRSYRIPIPQSHWVHAERSAEPSPARNKTSGDFLRQCSNLGEEGTGSPLLSNGANAYEEQGSPSLNRPILDHLNRQSPLFRRKSSDAVLSCKGFGPVEDPSTPTKGANPWLRRAPQLLTSPENSIGSVTSSPSHTVPSLPIKPSHGSAVGTMGDPQVTPHRTCGRLYTSITSSPFLSFEQRQGPRLPLITNSELSVSPPVPYLRRPKLSTRHSSSTLDELKTQPPGDITSSPYLTYCNRLEVEFDTVEVIGVGEFGEVFKARKCTDSQFYAVKRAKRIVRGPKARARLFEEVEILRRLSQREKRSPFIIQFFDAWEYGNRVNIQAEFCENGTLEGFLELVAGLQNSLEEARMWKIISELSQAISFMHSAGVLHLDIKPANIFVTARGGLKVGDFGLAKRWPRIDPRQIEECGILDGKYTVYQHRPVAREPLAAEEEEDLKIVPEKFILYRDIADTEERRMMRLKSDGRFVGFDLEREGDREYIAPEVLSGRYGEEADVYSIGLIALEIGTNVMLPDNGDEWTGLRSNDFSQIDLSGLSSEMVMIMKQMLERSPDRRMTADTLIQHPVLKRVGTLREAGIREEAKLDNSDQLEEIDGMGDVEMKTGDVAAGPDWKIAKGAILPEAEGFLEFILTGPNTPTRSKTKKTLRIDRDVNKASKDEDRMDLDG